MKDRRTIGLFDGDRQPFRRNFATEWSDTFVLSSSAATPGARSRLLKEVRNGTLRRVLHGIYLASATWDAFDDDARYRARVHATAMAYGKTLVFSHYSAAALWGLPIVGSWPTTAHVVANRASGGRSRRSLVRHCDGLPEDVTEIDGLLVTTLARTVTDMAKVASFGAAVAMADHALRPKPMDAEGVAAASVTPVELFGELARLRRGRGSAACRRVFEFADGASESPGESVSRVGIHLLRLPPPLLQVEFTDYRGRIGYADFFWPELGLIGEFDGRGKYLRDEFTRGRTAAEVIIDEKKREDRMRAIGHSMTRWGWDVARSLPRLRAHLAAAGLR